jgi:Flp pilus assembly protein TadD
MGTEDISKLVEFADRLVHEKTGQHLETVAKDILRQTLTGKKLSAIEFPSYENSYVQRYLAPQLWKLLSYVAGEKVGKKTVLEVLKRLETQRPQLETAPENQSSTNPQAELNGHAALNGFVSFPNLKDGNHTSEGHDSVKPNELTPSEVDVSDYINSKDTSNRSHRQNHNHLNSGQAYGSWLLIDGQLRELSQANHANGKKVEDGSPDFTTQEFQSSDKTYQGNNADETKSNTDGWFSFMNFMKPGMPLLLSLGVIGCLFGLSWLANWYGVKNHVAGQLPKAQFGYSLALKLNPWSAAGHYNQGVTYEDQHNYERAHAEYQLAIEGGLIEAYNNQARLYILQENYDAAVSLLRIGLEVAKDDRIRADMYKNRGWARLEQGRYAEAKLDLTEAIRRKSDHASAHCLLAQVLERDRNQKGALSEWEKCLGFAYQPNTPEEDKLVHLARQRLEAERGGK